MSTFTENIQTTFHIVVCYHCALRFGIPSDLYRRAVINAVGGVHCPACGQETVWRESEASRTIRQLEQKLKWEAEESARQKNRKEELEASLSAHKGMLTKLRKRVGAGTCPCCNRTFKQLSAHMAQKHPDYLSK